MTYQIRNEDEEKEIITARGARSIWCNEDGNTDIGDEADEFRNKKDSERYGQDNHEVQGKEREQKGKHKMAMDDSDVKNRLNTVPDNRSGERASIDNDENRDVQHNLEISTTTDGSNPREYS